MISYDYDNNLTERFGETSAPFLEDEKSSGNNDFEMTSLRGAVQKARFPGLKRGEAYTVKISTIINGKTVCLVSADVN